MQTTTVQRSVCSSFLILALVGTSAGQDKRPPSRSSLPGEDIARVFVIVNSVPEEYSAKAMSYVRRELRSLGDVEVANDTSDVDFVLELSLMEVRGALAYSYECRMVLDLRPDVINVQLKVQHDTQLGETEAKAVSDVIRSYGATMSTGPAKIGTTSLGIKEVCEDFVIEVDTKVFEPRRETANETRKMIEEIIRQREENNQRPDEQ